MRGCRLMALSRRVEALDAGPNLHKLIFLPADERRPMTGRHAAYAEVSGTGRCNTHLRSRRMTMSCTLLCAATSVDDGCSSPAAPAKRRQRRLDPTSMHDAWECARSVFGPCLLRFERKRVGTWEGGTHQSRPSSRRSSTLRAMLCSAEAAIDR
jgi:hypothetical protein